MPQDSKQQYHETILSERFIIFMGLVTFGTIVLSFFLGAELGSQIACSPRGALPI